MNETQVRALLQLRLELTGDSFNRGMLDAWLAELGDIDQGEAVLAMRRACKKTSHVQWHAFATELDAHRHAKANDHRPERLDCGDCDGTGWRETSLRQWDRCDHQRRAGRVVPFADGIAIVAVACETEMRARGVPFSEIERRMESLLGLVHALTEGDTP